METMNFNETFDDSKVRISFLNEDDDEWKKRQYSIVAPILAILGVGALLLNVYVLLSGFYLKRSASLNLWFSLSLSAVDMYSATLIVVNIFLQSYLPTVRRVEPDKCVLIVTEMLRLGGLISSILHLLALALTHFLGVMYPLRRHSWIVTKRRRILALILLWICPSVALFVSMSSVPGQAFLSADCRNLTFASEFPFRATVCTAVATPMLATFVFYFCILWKLKMNDRDPVLRDARPTRQNKKLFCTMILLMGTFLLGWFPSVLLYFSYCDDCPWIPRRVHMRTVTVVAVCVQLLIILKLFSNPLIYALRIGELRYALSQLNKRICGIRGFGLENNTSTQHAQSRQQNRSNDRNSLGNVKQRASDTSGLERQRFLA